MPHLCVEHGKESKEKIEPDHIWEVEAYIPLVWEKYRKPSGLRRVRLILDYRTHEKEEK